jgi:hypothetical protein
MKTADALARYRLVLPRELKHLFLEGQEPFKLRQYACWCADEAIRRCPAASEIFRTTLDAAKNYAAGKIKLGQLQRTGKICEQRVSTLHRQIMQLQRDVKAGVKPMAADYLDLYSNWAAGQAAFGCSDEEPLKAVAGAYTWLRALWGKLNEHEATQAISRIAEDVLQAGEHGLAPGKLRELQRALCILPSSLSERIPRSSPESTRTFAAKCLSAAIDETAIDDRQLKRAARLADRYARGALTAEELTAATTNGDRLAKAWQDIRDEKLAACTAGSISLEEYRQAEIKSLIAHAVAACFAVSPFLASVRASSQSRRAIQLSRDHLMLEALQAAAQQVLGSPTKR